MKLTNHVLTLISTLHSRLILTFITDARRNNAQWSPMGPRYPGQHMNPNFGPQGGMSMSSPYPRSHMRMSPNRDKHMSPQRMQVYIFRLTLEFLFFVTLVNYSQTSLSRRDHADMFELSEVRVI